MLLILLFRYQFHENVVSLGTMLKMYGVAFAISSTGVIFAIMIFREAFNPNCDQNKMDALMVVSKVNL